MGKGTRAVCLFLKLERVYASVNRAETFDLDAIGSFIVLITKKVRNFQGFW